MKFSLVEAAALLALVALYFGFRSGKLNPASRDNVLYQATGEIGLKIPDLWGGIFKSDAEREVDILYGQTRPPASGAPTPTQKPVLVPRSYYDLGAKPVPAGEARIINPSGTLTSGEYRDLVR